MSGMHRNRAVYVIPLSLLMGSKAFAADQIVTPEPAGGMKDSARIRPVSSSATQATAVESLRVQGRKPSTVASSATKTDTPSSKQHNPLQSSPVARWTSEAF